MADTMQMSVIRHSDDMNYRWAGEL